MTFLRYLVKSVGDQIYFGSSLFATCEGDDGLLVDCSVLVVGSKQISESHTI